MIAGLQQWWIGLSRRERIATASAAALVVAALLYLVAIEPAWRTRERLAADLPRLRAEAAEVESLRLEARGLKDHALRLDSAAQARAAVTKLLQEKQLAGAQVRETDDRELVVSMRGADVAVWLAALREMTSEMPLRVAQARLARTAPGLVDAEATLAPVGQKWQ
jgi:general secretion pathway protein M